MAVYEVQIKQINTTVADIAVEANSLEEAIAYLNSTNEYQFDSAFDNAGYTCSNEIEAIRKVHNITEIGLYDETSLAWNSEKVEEEV